MGVFRQFPYSNFHEMNMDEIIKIIKDMLEEWAQYHAEWDAWMDQMNDDWSNYQEVMNEAWQNMQDFINNYFDNLDVQQEINNKIDSMIIDGSFSALVTSHIPPRVTEWLQANITQPVGVVIDTSLTVAGACADAKATGDAIKEVNDDVGEYYQKFTMNNQYLATFYCINTGSFYFKLLEHPEATYGGVRIYGMTGVVETGIEETPLPYTEFYYDDISLEYDHIKITVGFGSQISGDVEVIFAPNGGYDLSSVTVNNTLNIKNMLRAVRKDITGDLYKDVPFLANKNITMDFTKCTVDSYLDIIQTSAIASISSRAIKIRDDDGNLYTDIYFIAPPTRDNDIMCFTFDRNGNNYSTITGAHLNDGFDENIYYIVLVNYWNLETVHALYDPTKEYVFEVKNTGTPKPYSSLSECLTRIAHVPFKKKVLVYSGTYDIYDEIGGDDFANNIDPGTNWRTVSVVAENNTHIIGIGKVTLVMEPTTISSIAADLLSPLNISGNVTVENINIVCSNCRYGIHIEGSNLAKYNDSVCTLKNVNVTRKPAVGDAQRNGPAIGVGMNIRCCLVVEDCYIKAIAGWACIYYHENYGDEALSPELRVINSILDITSGASLALSASSGQTTMVETFIASSYIKTISKMTGGSTAFNDAYKIVMLNCNMPVVTKSEYLENEVPIEHFNTIS